MKPFEIFRAGRHTSSQGKTLTFSADDLKAIVAGYDPALHQAPIVVGHPKTDDPAFGWVSGLSLKGDRLVAAPDQLDATFADLVKEGKYLKRSAAFYPPDAPNNPTPGQYYLRHVGFLGAAAPAVKGLKPVEFDDGTLILEFEDGLADWRQSWALEVAARMFRGVRDWIIETKDIETADKVVSQWDIDQISQAAADLRADATRADASSAFSEATKKEDVMTKTPEQLAVELDAREQGIAAREAAFAESERQARSDADAAFVDSVVKAGRLPVGLQATATALFADLGDDEITFADGDETRKTSPRAAFRDLLEKLPVPVETREMAAGEGPDFSDGVEFAAAIDVEIAAARDKGETITSAVAAARIQARAK